MILSDQKTPNVQLSNYNNYDLQKLHNYCAQYGKGTGAVSARAIKVEDIDRVTGYDPSQFKGYGDEKTYTLSDGTSTTLKSTYYFYYISDYLVQGTKAYDMLCGIKDYQLASISISVGSNSYADFSLRAVYDRYISGSVLYRTDGYSTWNNANTRPVVYLDEDIKLQKNGDTWDIVQ